MVAITKPLNHPSKIIFLDTKTLIVSQTLTVFLFLNKNWPWTRFPSIGNLNISTHFWNNLFDEVIISEITCSTSSSKNAFNKCLPTKIIRKQQLQLKENYLFVHNNIQYYLHINIRCLITLIVTLPALLRRY